jgi:hypothetical protein
MAIRTAREMKTSELLNRVSDRLAVEGWSRDLVDELRSRADRLDSLEHAGGLAALAAGGLAASDPAGLAMSVGIVANAPAGLPADALGAAQLRDRVQPPEGGPEGTDCQLCRARVKDWEGSDPRCAFRTGVFSGDNWNCATMGFLCQLVEDRATWSQDHAVLVLAVPDEVAESVDDSDCHPTHVVIHRYKNRGRVQLALAVDAAGCVYPLSSALAGALAALGRA